MCCTETTKAGSPRLPGSCCCLRQVPGAAMPPATGACQSAKSCAPSGSADLTVAAAGHTGKRHRSIRSAMADVALGIAGIVIVVGRDGLLRLCVPRGLDERSMRRFRARAISGHLGPAWPGWLVSPGQSVGVAGCCQFTFRCPRRPHLWRLRVMRSWACCRLSSLAAPAPAQVPWVWDHSTCLHVRALRRPARVAEDLVGARVTRVPRRRGEVPATRCGHRW